MGDRTVTGRRLSVEARLGPELRASHPGAQASKYAAMNSGYTLFETPFGRSGIAWRDDGIVAIQLAEASDAATVRKLLVRNPAIALAKPPAWIAEATRAIREHLSGRPQDLSRLSLALDDVPRFHRAVYAEARKVASGSTVSYGELAARVGSPGAARAVGQAMARNPFILAVPCHRILGSGGSLGGFSARGGVRTKARLLELERRVNGGDDAASPLFAARRAEEHGLEYDPKAAVRHLKKADERLAAVIARVGELTLRAHAAPPFDALAQAIAHQQLAGAAARTIVARLKALFPARAFPRPEDIRASRVAKLRKAGFSRPKVLALKDLARAALDGTIPAPEELRSLSDDAIVARLDPIRGIGRWTVEMLLIFRLGRPDVLPVDDFGVRKGFQRALGLREMPTPRAVMEYGERWRPFRSVASWYLWRAAEEA